MSDRPYRGYGYRYDLDRDDLHRMPLTEMLDLWQEEEEWRRVRENGRRLFWIGFSLLFIQFSLANVLAMFG